MTDHESNSTDSNSVPVPVFNSTDCDLKVSDLGPDVQVSQANQHSIPEGVLITYHLDLGSKIPDLGSKIPVFKETAVSKFNFSSNLVSSSVHITQSVRTGSTYSLGALSKASSSLALAVAGVCKSNPVSTVKNEIVEEENCVIKGNESTDEIENNSESENEKENKDEIENGNEIQNLNRSNKIGNEDENKLDTRNESN